MEEYVSDLEKLVEELQQRTAEAEHKSAKTHPVWDDVTYPGLIFFGTPIYVICQITVIHQTSPVDVKTYQIRIPRGTSYQHFNDIYGVVFKTLEEAKQAVEEIYNFYINE